MVYESGGLYQTVTSHAPQIYKKYEWNEGLTTYHEISQADNIITVGTVKLLNN